MVKAVVTIIPSLLGRNETVTGMRQKLIVRTSLKKSIEIKSLLEKNDGQLKSLRITVKQGLKSQLNLLQEEVRVEVPIVGSGRVILNRGTKDGLVLESKPGKGVVRGKLYKRESFLDKMIT
jgi:hypothetical protein